MDGRVGVTQSHAMSDIHAISKPRRAAKRHRLDERFDEHTAVRLDHASREHVVWIRHDLDVAKSFAGRVSQHLAERAGRVSPLLLPRNNRVPDVTEAMWRQCLRAGLP